MPDKINSNLSFNVLIVGNYKPDSQVSMDKYAKLLLSFYSSFNSKIVYPTSFVGAFKLIPFARKYFAYIDKLILFPFWLIFNSYKYDVIHIADHGNAYYSFFCQHKKCIVTCHDLLAMRAVFGDKSVVVYFSRFGIWLQRLIYFGLKSAGTIVFVSESTKHDFYSLISKPIHQRHVLIYSPLNSNYTSLLNPNHRPRTVCNKIFDKPFLLMVGSSQPRKNRSLALQLIVSLKGRYNVIMAGAPLTSYENQFKANNQFGDCLVSIVRPDQSSLNYLYCKAHALLFPSFSEGFGWPVIEAQACHCPVIASNTTSIPEIGGMGALYCSPNDVENFSTNVVELEDPLFRANLIQKGIKNLKKYNYDIAKNSYTDLLLNL